MINKDMCKVIQSRFQSAGFVVEDSGDSGDGYGNLAVFYPGAARDYFFNKFISVVQSFPYDMDNLSCKFDTPNRVIIDNVKYQPPSFQDLLMSKNISVDSKDGKIVVYEAPENLQSTMGNIFKCFEKAYPNDFLEVNVTYNKYVYLINTNVNVKC